MSRPILPALALLVTLVSTMPADADAQRRGRQPQVTDAPWASFTAGIHFGYDDNSNGEVLGTHLRIPLLRSGHVELLPSGDVTFLTGLREYQYNVDAVFVTQGSRGGLYAGGGLGWRNSIFGTGSDRETLRSTNLVVGFKTASGGSFGFQVEMRWMLVSDSDFDPRLLHFGLNFPLTNRGRRPGS